MTPKPSDVATPKIVPSTAKVSTVCPIGPWMRSPISGNSDERIRSGSPWRNAKYASDSATTP